MWCYGGPAIDRRHNVEEVNRPVIVSLVRFTSRLPDEEVVAMFEKRSDRYRKVPGLVEKLYLRFRDTGEFGAVYVWESEEDLERFRESELARTIPTAYQVEGESSLEVADVPLVVDPDRVLIPG
jgi:heme-degrading monooxygenase HmoA